MITKEQLYGLGYEVKTNVIGGSTDFRISGSESSPYLVNLKDGSIRIIFGINVTNKLIEFVDFEYFKEWHRNFHKSIIK